MSPIDKCPMDNVLSVGCCYMTCRKKKTTSLLSRIRTTAMRVILVMCFILEPTLLTGRSCRFSAGVVDQNSWCTWYGSAQAFHMDQMVLDAKSALASHQIRTYRKPSSATSPSRRSLPSLEAALPTHIVSALENVSHLPLLMIEVQPLVSKNGILTKPFPRAFVFSMSPALQKCATWNSSWKYWYITLPS